MFYGGVVQRGKTSVFVPPPVACVRAEDEHSLHLSQASLAADVKEGTRVSLLAKVEGEEPVIVATLCAGRLDSVALDLFFSEYTEFTVAGGADVHISGYYSPQTIGDEDEDEEGEEGEAEDEEHEGHPQYGSDLRAAYADAFDTDEEEESEDEEDEDEDESEEDEEEEDEDMMGLGRSGEPSVVIEDITDQVTIAAAMDAKGQQQKPGNGPPRITAAQQAEDSDDDDEDEEDEEEDEEEEGEEEEEEAPAPSKQPAAATPAKGKGSTQQNGQQQAAAAGGKRKGAAAEVPAGKKQATGSAAPGKQQANGAQTPANTPAKASEDEPKAAPVSSGKKKGVRRFENGFEVHELAMGAPNGKLAKAGKRVAMRYVGRLKSNGKVFDKSTGKPFTFRLGVGEVIKGWDAGVEGMRVGDKRKLVIPPQMAYGNARTGPIPPGSWLEFDVELVDVK